MRVPYAESLARLVAALLVAVPASASAQAPGWTAWIGCWTPAVDGAMTSGEARLTTCVLPGDAPQSMEIVTVAADSVVMRSTMTADGASRPISAEGCSGTETARFSADGARVYVAGEITCGEGPMQRTSGVLSISETGQWVDVHGVMVGEQQTLRVRRSRAAPVPSALDPSDRAAITRAARAAEGARVAAALPTTPERVIDAADALDARVAEAWVIESSRDAARMAPLDKRAVLALAEAEVPARVIDAMVALSYPQHFQVLLADDGRVALADAAQGGQAETAHPRWMYHDVFSYSLYGPGSCITYSCFAFYRDWSYRNYYRGLAGWDFYGGYGMYPGWGYGGGPIVIVPGDGTGGGAAGGGGRVVKGQGYRRNPGSGGQAAEPRSTASPSSPSSPSSTSGSTRTATRSSGSSSGSTKAKPAESTPRTAKPRKP